MAVAVVGSEYRMYLSQLKSLATLIYINMLCCFERT